MDEPRTAEHAHEFVRCFTCDNDDERCDVDGCSAHRVAARAEVPRPCARYFGSDGTLCATHSGRFPSPSDARCDRAGRAEVAEPDRQALRERVWSAQHGVSCEDDQPHTWQAHLPWDSDDDRIDAEREADAIIAALGVRAEVAEPPTRPTRPEDTIIRRPDALVAEVAEPGDGPTCSCYCACDNRARAAGAMCPACSGGTHRVRPNEPDMHPDAVYARSDAWHEPTPDEVREYRLDAVDPENRALNWSEYRAHRAATAEREPLDALREAARAVLTELDIIRRQPDDQRAYGLRVHPDTHEALRAALDTPDPGAS